MADQYLGKYRAILIFSCIYFVGLIILTCTSIPAAIDSGATFPGYIVAIIIIGLGTGGIKSNVSPLVAEQYRSRSPFVRTLKDGTRVIVTPQATYQKIFALFYWVSFTWHIGCVSPFGFFLTAMITGYQCWFFISHCYHTTGEKHWILACFLVANLHVHPLYPNSVAGSQTLCAKSTSWFCICGSWQAILYRHDQDT